MATSTTIDSNTPELGVRPFRLLDLPVELRLEIYDFFFSSFTTNISTSNPGHSSAVANLLAILYTNKPIFAKASPIAQKHRKGLIRQMENDVIWLWDISNTDRLDSNNLQGFWKAVIKVDKTFPCLEAWRERLGLE